MNFLLDIFLFLLFLLIVIVSTDRGFVSSVWNTVTVIGAFILAYMFSGIVADLICKNFVLNYVTEYAYGVVAALIESNTATYDISGLFESLPQDFVSLVEHCGADMAVLEQQFGTAVSVSVDDLFEFAESIALPISQTLSNAIAIVSVFLISLLLLWLFGLIIKVIVKIPIIRTLNSLLGFMFGLVKGFIVVWILCVTLSIFVERGFMNPNSVEVLNELTSSSHIFRFFCSFSPINFINIS